MEIKHPVSKFRVRDSRYIWVFNKLCFIIKNETYLSTKDVRGTQKPQWYFLFFKKLIIKYQLYFGQLVLKLYNNLNSISAHIFILQG